jgi:hypothetical protein
LNNCFGSPQTLFRARLIAVNAGTILDPFRKRERSWITFDGLGDDWPVKKIYDDSQRDKNNNDSAHECSVPEAS